LFFALWPPRAAAQELHAWALVAQHACGGRVTRAETIHLTLAFLGEIDEKRLVELESVSVKGGRHALPIEQARYWPHNRIVWVGPQEIPVLLQSLAENLKDELERKGFRTEKRPFAAHITLIRKARDAGELPSLPAVVWPVEEFVLVRSQLLAAGPNYEVLQRYPIS
jgi:2'-5' RNA ligase